jgi:hypothetical protein
LSVITKLRAHALHDQVCAHPGVNRTSSEPPSHRDCAEFAVRACPFLTNRDPGLQLSGGRTIGLPEDIRFAPGLGLRHNPGVALLWVTKAYRPGLNLPGVPAEAVAEAGARPGVLFDIGEPVAIRCYREGRAATREEIEAAIAKGLPTLRATAASQGPRAMTDLASQLQAFEQLLEAHV